MFKKSLLNQGLLENKGFEVIVIYLMFVLACSLAIYPFIT